MKTRRSSDAAIDWDSIKRRLATAAQALDDEFVPPPARLRAVLAERARQLAQTLPPPAQSGPELELFEFLVGGDRYAIGMEYVEGVHALKEITPLPGTPAFVLGIVNLHGCITAVVDLQALLALPASARSEADRLILLSGGDMRFCLLADRIIGGAVVARDTIRTTSAGAAASDFLLGMTSGRLMVLDGESLLSDQAVVMS